MTNLPIGTKIRGNLENIEDFSQLDEDIINITLPSGLIIDVGWYPAYDPNESFKVAIYKEYWHNQVAPLFQSKSITEVKKHILKLTKIKY